MIGLDFEVLVSVTMDHEDAATIAAFEQALTAVAAIRHAERLFGDPDYLLRVLAAELPSYAVLRDEHWPRCPASNGSPRRS